MVMDRYNRLVELTQKSARITRVRLSHWPDFFRLMNFFARRKEGGWQWVFRGQENAAWGLQSSLERDIRTFLEKSLQKLPQRDLSIVTGKVVHDERRVINEFRSLVRNRDDLSMGVLDDLGRSPVHCLAFLQHYGAKTRLLDFTYSLGVASYFAYATRTTGQPRSIWALNIDSIVGRIPKMKEDLSHRSAIRRRIDQYASGSRDWPEDITRDFDREFGTIADEILAGERGYDRGVIPIRLAGSNRRLDAQNGLFLFPLVASPFEENLARTLNVSQEQLRALRDWESPADHLSDSGIRTSKYNDYSLLKIDFDPKMESRAWNILDQMQLIPRMLFPDLEGLAKGVRLNYECGDE